MIALIIVAAVSTERVKPIRQILAPTCACYVLIKKSETNATCISLGPIQERFRGASLWGTA